jgi:uncharacterized protein YndB with AHSA1/START domain
VSGSPREVRVRQAISASREALWRAIATAEGWALWQADDVEGSVVSGGSVTLLWPGLGAKLPVNVLEVREGQHVVMGARQWVVRLALTEEGVAVTHEGATNDDEAFGTRSAWRCSLALLAHALERHPERTRHVAWAVEPTRVATEVVHAYFAESAPLSLWWGRGASLGDAGEPCAFELLDGDRASGRVLANTPGRDVVFSWSERDEAVVTFRTFPLGREDRLVALGLSRFGAPVERADAERLGLAVRRLARALAPAARA